MTDAVVYDLPGEAGRDALVPGHAYRARVTAIDDGALVVEVADDCTGRVGPDAADGPYASGDHLAVECVSVDGEPAFRPIDPTEARTVAYERTTTAADVGDASGDCVRIAGVVVRIDQTAGPTVFGIADGTGVVPCAAFEAAGVRAYPDIERGAAVSVVGRVERRDGGVQVEVDHLAPVGGGAETALRDRVAERRAEHAVPRTVPPMADWDADGLHDAVTDAAERIRRAILNGRPVRVRHHADGDGIAAAVPLERAVRAFVAETHADAAAPYHAVRRSPSKAPYYELEDAIRDLDSALRDRTRHGRRLPLVVLLDNGSTTDDLPAYRLLDEYDVPVVVVDHHHPDDIDAHVDAHVNPYRHGADYAITTGMCCAELARLVAPTDDALGRIDHVPAVAGLSDRSSAPAMETYRERAAEAGYDLDDLHAIGDALDFAAHHLRYSPGRELLADALGVTGADRHRDLVDSLAARARDRIGDQLDAALDHVDRETLDNGADCHRIDLDADTMAHVYPAPGGTTGAIHDRVVADRGVPAITIGYGPDYAILRSDGVRLDIPRIVDDLADRLPGAGVGGGGHLVVGAIDFVPGARDAVLEALTDELGAAAINEDLGSSARAAAQ